MLEGVLKVVFMTLFLMLLRVSILGMLEGVLNRPNSTPFVSFAAGFNPWYVGGGVKSRYMLSRSSPETSFNPWYVGGGVKSLGRNFWMEMSICFNPWYVGGGVKSRFLAIAR